MIKASIILSVMFLVFRAEPVSSQSDYTVMTPDKIAGWEAVGRITRSLTGARETCTGTLVRPGKVLTAAHCVSRQFGKAAQSNPDLIFQAGKSGLYSLEVAKVSRISYHPSYVPGSGLENVIPHDLAVLHLTQAMERVAPMPIAIPPITDVTVSFLGHRADGRNPPRLTENCTQQMLSPRVLEIGCQAISGNSGGGVIWEHAGERRLVAVISAAGNGRSFAAVPDAWLFSVLGAE